VLEVVVVDQPFALFCFLRLVPKALKLIATGNRYHEKRSSKKPPNILYQKALPKIQDFEGLFTAGYPIFSTAQLAMRYVEATKYLRRAIV